MFLLEIEPILGQYMGGGGSMMIYYAITGLFMLLSMAVGKRLQAKFQEYSQSPLQMSGKEVAEKMLNDCGIYDVQVVSVPGQLTDHYNPKTKTVNLSEVVFNERNVAAAAVAAHECGHAVQHATAYSFLTMRSNMVPVVNISSKFMPMALMAGLGLAAFSGNITVLLIAVLLFAATTLFSFVTLPVEFDASKRALNWLNDAGITQGEQHQQAKNALKWAAGTYVVAALASLGQLLYYVFLLNRYRN